MVAGKEIHRNTGRRFRAIILYSEKYIEYNSIMLDVICSVRENDKLKKEKIRVSIISKKLVFELQIG